MRHYQRWPYMTSMLWGYMRIFETVQHALYPREIMFHPAAAFHEASRLRWYEIKLIHRNCAVHALEFP